MNDPVGIDNGDGTWTTATFKNLCELSAEELDAFEIMLREEIDPVKIRLKFKWIQSARSAALRRKMAIEDPTENNENYADFSFMFTVGIEEVVRDALPTDPCVLHHLETHGERFDGQTWTEYQHSIAHDKFPMGT